MASPPLPPALEHLNNRPFSFYPAIIGIEHNEWLFRKATWSELLVVNCKTGEEIWIPRRFLGEVSRTDDPVVIVGLNRELEFKAGSVMPYQRRVIEMPVAVGGFPPSAPSATPESRSGPAPVVGIRLEPADRGIVKLIGIAVAIGFSLCVIAVYHNRVGELLERNVTYAAKDQAYLELTPRDDYTAVVNKIGKPESERWNPNSQEFQWRALAYPQRGWTVILMGESRDTAHYIGAMNEKWKPVHSVNANTLSLLRNLREF